MRAGGEGENAVFRGSLTSLLWAGAPLRPDEAFSLSTVVTTVKPRINTTWLQRKNRSEVVEEERRKHLQLYAVTYCFCSLMFRLSIQWQT